MSSKSPTSSGFGRVLILIYGIFAVSASARVTVQLIRDWHTAPLAYALSALAAVVYIVATFCLAGATVVARRGAWGAVMVEFVGVVAVGAFSAVNPESFPKATVWSHFGQGYGFIPLVLPLIGMVWLSRTSAVSPDQEPPN